MPVNSTATEYQASLADWQRVRDATQGQRAVKARAKTYLPDPDPTDAERYAAYLLRAVYVNYTGRTLAGLLGMVGRKAPTVELPPDLEYLLTDADGDGLGLEQLSKVSLAEVLMTGRCGLLVDYPDAPAGLSAEQVDLLNLGATIAVYSAESVLNWNTITVGGSEVLSLVVLVEVEDSQEDEFEEKLVPRYRVLRLRDGVYTQQLYNEKLEPGEEITPTDANGNPWAEIPFAFIGSEDNKPCVDRSPLLDLAEINLAHYRNSADYEEGIFIHGQGTLFLSSELSADQFKTANPNGIKVGSRRGHFLGAGGSATLLQMSANGAAREAMQDKEAQMLAIGAKIITPQGGTETAEAARIRNASETSVLANIVGNVSNAIERAIKWAAVFMGTDADGVEFALNREFFDVTLNAQDVMAFIQLADRGDIAQSDIRARLRAANWIAADRTDDDIDQEADAEGGGLDLDPEPPPQPVVQVVAPTDGAATE